MADDACQRSLARHIADVMSADEADPCMTANVRVAQGLFDERAMCGSMYVRKNGADRWRARLMSYSDRHVLYEYRNLHCSSTAPLAALDTKRLVVDWWHDPAAPSAHGSEGGIVIRIGPPFDAVMDLSTDDEPSGGDAPSGGYAPDDKAVPPHEWLLCPLTDAEAKLWIAVLTRKRAAHQLRPSNVPWSSPAVFDEEVRHARADPSAYAAWLAAKRRHLGFLRVWASTEPNQSDRRRDDFERCIESTEACIAVMERATSIAGENTMRA